MGLISGYGCRVFLTSKVRNGHRLGVASVEHYRYSMCPSLVSGPAHRRAYLMPHSYQLLVTVRLVFPAGNLWNGTVLPRPDNVPGIHGVPEYPQIPQCEDHIENSWPKAWGVAGLHPIRLFPALLNN